ncbi:MAG: flavodoxin family protein, partial [Oscillospiraceae bacterium]
MKTVIINGSMRKKGNTAFLIDEFKKIIKGEIIQYNLSELNFTPCINCRCCVRLGHCCIKDDITEVYLNVIDCDALVIASPLYFSQLTGNVLNFMSRAEWVYLLKNNKNGLESKLEVKKKISAVILNGGGNTNLCNDITFPLKEFFH